MQRMYYTKHVSNPVDQVIAFKYDTLKLLISKIKIRSFLSVMGFPDADSLMSAN